MKILKRIRNLFSCGGYGICKVNDKTEISLQHLDGEIPECPICFNDVSERPITFLPCDHWACTKCMEHMFINKGMNKCHICRTKYKNITFFIDVK